MILTLDIPDTLVDRLRSEAEARGEDLNNYAVAKLELPAIVDEDAEEEPDEDLIAALREGLAQADAGQLLTMEQVSEGVYAALASHRKKTAA